MPPDLAPNTHGKGNEHLTPEPAARLSFAKPLDEVAR
jgi:hypothetical protein